MNTIKKLNIDDYSPDEKPSVINMTEEICSTMDPVTTFIPKSVTEIITLEEDIQVVGLSLQKSGLPISFDSLGPLWANYGDKYRYHMMNQKEPIVEYGVSLNKIPDYITGCAVTKVEELEEQFAAFTIPKGQYIKDSFNAETFFILTTDAMQQRNVQGWAKENKVKINKEFSIEVYPLILMFAKYPEMYTLTPIKE